MEVEAAVEAAVEEAVESAEEEQVEAYPGAEAVDLEEFLGKLPP